MNKPYPPVGIAILNWNGRHFLETLLPHLKTLTYSNYTVYVIDNNSSDDSVAFLKSSFPEVIVIELEDNFGFAGGYNRGIRLLREEYILMMNSDVEVAPSFIEPMVELMEQDHQTAVCQPKILALRNKTGFEHAGAAGGMIDFLGYPFCRGRVFEHVESDHGQYNEVADIFWASGACCMIRKTAYTAIGGLYDYFFMHSEEIDLCWRLLSAGFRIVYCPQAYIYHLGGGSLSYESPRKTYFNFRNNIVMCTRNSPVSTLLWLIPVRMALDFAAALQFLVKKKKSNSKQVLRAYIHFFKWLVLERNKFPGKKRALTAIPVVLKKSIVWQYYVKGLPH